MSTDWSKVDFAGTHPQPVDDADRAEMLAWKLIKQDPGIAARVAELVAVPDNVVELYPEPEDSPPREIEFTELAGMLESFTGEIIDFTVTYEPHEDISGWIAGGSGRIDQVKLSDADHGRLNVWLERDPHLPEPVSFTISRARLGLASYYVHADTESGDTTHIETVQSGVRNSITVFAGTATP